MSKRSPVEFESVRLDRMPGFPPNPPFGVEGLKPGVNLVTGPNMSGKTTLARGMSTVLWPGSAPKKAEVTGVLRYLGSSWTLRVEERKIQSCQRDHRNSDPPELPSVGLRGRYHVSLVDLLQVGRGADGFAQEISRATAGGYDLAQAASEAGAKSVAGRHSKEAKALETARRAVREQRKHQEELARRESELAELEEKRNRAEGARHEMRRLEAALELRETKQAVNEAEGELAAYAPGMELVAGTEADTLQSIKDKLSREREAMSQSRVERDSARATAKATDLPEGGVAGELLQSMRSRQQDLSGLERSVRERQEAQARAAAKVAVARRALGEEPGGARPVLDVMALGELERLSASAERLSGHRQALRSQVSMLESGGESVDDDVRRLGLGRSQLVGWLKTPVEGGARPRAPRGPIIAIAALMAIAGLLLVALVHWGFLGLVAVGGVASFWALRGRQEGSVAGSRAHFEREFEALGLGKPGSWTAEGVGQLLEELEEREAAARLTQQRLTELLRFRRDLAEVDREQGALVEERTKLLAQYGAAPQIEGNRGEAVFAAFAKLVVAWHEANMAEAEAAAAVAELTGQAAAVCRELSESMTSLGYEAGTNSADIQGALDDLVERRGQFERAVAQQQGAEVRCAEHEARITDLEGELSALYERLGLSNGDEAGLQDAVRQLESHAACKRKLENAQTNRKTASTRLVESGGTEELADLSHEELARRVEVARAEEASWQGLIEQITEITKAIEVAGGSTAATDALAVQEDALEELRRCREADLESVAVGVLVDHLKEQVRSHSRPQVFRRAAELLATITAGKCRLDMEDSEPARFTVVESGDVRARDLSELSAGTRLQLMLAVRLAFVEVQEKGAALPLLLDETLANSDEERSLAIVEAAAALATKGRQVFYFTAQHDEVRKWMAMSKHLRQPDPNIVDLAKIRKLEQSQTVPLPEAVELPPAPPAPEDGESHMEYGQRLGVAGVDPRIENIDGVHVWHLLQAPGLVHELLKLRVSTWGQYRTLSEHRPGEGGILGSEEGARMEAAALAIEEAARLWRVGKGKPVTRSVLRASDAVSDNFIDPVADLADKPGGEASKLVAALSEGQARGFRSNKLEQLTEYLTREGYLDNREPLPESEARIRVMGALAGRVESGEITSERVAELVAGVYAFEPL